MRLLPILLAVVLTGCTFGVVTKKDPSTVRVGMSKQEVIQTLGKPHGVAANDTEETFRYNVANSGIAPIAGGWNEYYLRFVDGKLVSVGPKSK